MSHASHGASKPLAEEDLAHIAAQARTAFERMRGARLFLTGGTGFFGHWLLESLLYANRELRLDVRATVLTRSAEAFRVRAPHIAHDAAITLVEGDIRSFALPAEDGAAPFTHILHAATDSTGGQEDQPAYALAESILEGTRRVLRLARDHAAWLSANEAKRSLRLLYVSSGAVYGRSTTLEHTPETYNGAPDPLQLASSYDEAKRMAEHLCVAYAAGTSMEPVIARCFAFVGAHLPLDRHFAIGNFIGSALRGEPIHIKGDGSPRRSWLYMGDLAIWLWTLLTIGEPNRAYNVGSDEGYTIAEAALLVAETLAPGLPLQIDGTPKAGAPLNSYVPSIERARSELGLQVTVPLAEALQRTAAWHRGGFS